MKQHQSIPAALLAVCLSFTSCEKGGVLVQESVVKPTPDTPTIPADPASHRSTLQCYYPPQSLRYPADAMGYSYKIGSEFGLGETVMPIFDVRMLEADMKKSGYNCYERMKVLYSESPVIHVFSNFKGYAKEKFDGAIFSRYKINIDRFDARCEELLRKSLNWTTSEQNSVYGEVGDKYIYAKYSIVNTYSYRQRIAQDYLTPNFVQALYSKHPRQVLDEYGLLVVMGYYTGTQLTVRLARQEKAGLSDEEKENHMFQACRYTIDGGSNIGIRESFDSKAVPYAERTHYGVWLTGGMSQPDHQVVLSRWFQQRHTNDECFVLTGFPNNGLSTLADFVLEENFAQRIINAHNGFLLNDSELLTPYITVARLVVNTSSDPYLCDIVPVLHTRQGDLIAFRSNIDQPLNDEELRRNDKPEVYAQKSEAVKTQKAQYFGCDIRILEKWVTIDPMDGSRLTMVIPAIDESRMRKFTNPNTNICYLYDPVSMVALSYLDKPEIAADILDAYGITEWVKSLPVEPITMGKLSRKYRIIGL